jgi:glyceraldehyde-3-phosphate dehydrogenase/erythrose-4-phosphate dehydrogenase
MVKVGVNRFGYIGCMVMITRSAILSASGKVEIVTINKHFIDFNYIVYMLQYDSTHDSMAQSRLRMGSFSSLGNPSQSSSSEILLTSKTVRLVLTIL